MIRISNGGNSFFIKRGKWPVTICLILVIYQSPGNNNLLTVLARFLPEPTLLRTFSGAHRKHYFLRKLKKFFFQLELCSFNIKCLIHHEPAELVICYESVMRSII